MGNRINQTELAKQNLLKIIERAEQNFLDALDEETGDRLTQLYTQYETKYGDYLTARER